MFRNSRTLVYFMTNEAIKLSDNTLLGGIATCHITYLWGRKRKESGASGIRTAVLEAEISSTAITSAKIITIRENLAVSSYNTTRRLLWQLGSIFSLLQFAIRVKHL